MPDEAVLSQLEGILRDSGLLPSNGVTPLDKPIADWIDSLGRLELVAGIEEILAADVEQDVMGEAAWRMNLSDVAELVERARSRPQTL